MGIGPPPLLQDPHKLISTVYNNPNPVIWKLNIKLFKLINSITGAAVGYNVSDAL